MNKLSRILFISNLYPNPLFPNMAAFNRQQINALAEFCEVDVISPVPWTICMKKKLNPVTSRERNITVHHPKYYYTPRVLRGMYGQFFYLSIKAIAMRLLDSNRYDLIYSSWLYPDSWAAAKLAQQYQLPLFVKVHGSDVNLLKPGSSVTKQSLAVVAQARKVICVSRALKEKLIELGAAEEKLEVIYNGVDRSIFNPVDRSETRRKLHLDSAEFIVLFVGNLKKEKGLDELIAAFKCVVDAAGDRQVRLVIIGSGSYSENTKQKVIELGIADKVDFLSSQPLTTIAQWMNAASVLCLPSYREGVPNVVLEALSCGTRVIATNVGGIPELDCGDGMLSLISPQSANLLADTLIDEMDQTDSVCASPSFIVSWRENTELLHACFK